MENAEVRGTPQEQIDRLTARLTGAEGDIAALQAGAQRASERADISEGKAANDSVRIDELETNTEMDRVLIRELQADGLLSQEHAANLEAALATSRMIGAAVGIIMAFYGVRENEAFEILRTVSMNKNRKLREVAEEVVETGDATGLPVRAACKGGAD